MFKYGGPVLVTTDMLGHLLSCLEQDHDQEWHIGRSQADCHSGN